MDEQISLVMTPDPHWSRGDQLQLLRLLFGPRLNVAPTAERSSDAVCSSTSGDLPPYTGEPASSTSADGLA